MHLWLKAGETKWTVVSISFSEEQGERRKGKFIFSRLGFWGGDGLEVLRRRMESFCSIGRDVV